MTETSAERSAELFSKTSEMVPNGLNIPMYESKHIWSDIFCVMRIFRKVLKLIPYQLNYISNDPPTDGGVCFVHLEQFGIKFQTFKKISRNYLCSPDSVISA